MDDLRRIEVNGEAKKKRIRGNDKVMGLTRVTRHPLLFGFATLGLANMMTTRTSQSSAPRVCFSMCWSTSSERKVQKLKHMCEYVSCAYFIYLSNQPSSDLAVKQHPSFHFFSSRFPSFHSSGGSICILGGFSGVLCRCRAAPGLPSKTLQTRIVLRRNILPPVCCHLRG